MSFYLGLGVPTSNVCAGISGRNETFFTTETASFLSEYEYFLQIGLIRIRQQDTDKGYSAALSN